MLDGILGKWQTNMVSAIPGQEAVFAFEERR